MEKINRLIKGWPRGAVYTSGFLKKKGFSKQLINRYKISGWLESIGTGAYIPEGSTVEWSGGLYALQQQLHLPVHPGGKTALILKGYGHFVTQNLKSVSLFALPNIRIPTWFHNHDWGVDISIVSKNLFSGNPETTLTDYSAGDFTIKISSPERAALEMADLIPDRQTFEEAYLLMENLISLRHKIVQHLLENCHSIKAKRLFMFLAENQQHSWFKNISLHNVDLGEGKRSVIKGGRLDKKYLITVPAEYHG